MTGHHAYGRQTQVRPVGQRDGQDRSPGLLHPPVGDLRAKAPLSRDLLLGVAAGVVATVMTGAVDRLLARFVSDAQKRHEKRVRQGAPHALAGPVFGEKLLGQTLTKQGKRRAQRIFSLGYGISWGLLYALVRRTIPQASRAAGLPFAIPSFAACDGAIAPLLKLTPTPEQVPWQLNAKELVNHVAWTVSAEMVHRLGRRIAG